MSKPHTKQPSFPVTLSSGQMIQRLISAAVFGAMPLLAPFTAQAAELEASDGVANKVDYFGYSSSLSCPIGIMGAGVMRIGASPISSQ